MRLPYHTVAPEGLKQILAVSNYISNSGLEKSLIDILYLRVSQINGCSYCIDMHFKDLVKDGMEPRKINAVIAFKYMPFFSDKEKAALSWAEAVTKLTNAEVPEELFTEMKKHFSDKEIVDVTYAIIQMNALNRLAITFEKHADK